MPRPVAILNLPTFFSLSFFLEYLNNKIVSAIILAPSVMPTIADEIDIVIKKKVLSLIQRPNPKAISEIEKPILEYRIAFSSPKPLIQKYKYGIAIAVHIVGRQSKNPYAYAEIPNSANIIGTKIGMR